MSTADGLNIWSTTNPRKMRCFGTSTRAEHNISCDAATRCYDVRTVRVATTWTGLEWSRRFSSHRVLLSARLHPLRPANRLHFNRSAIYHTYQTFVDGLPRLRFRAHGLLGPACVRVSLRNPWTGGGVTQTRTPRRRACVTHNFVIDDLIVHARTPRRRPPATTYVIEH